MGGKGAQQKGKGIAVQYIEEEAEREIESGQHGQVLRLEPWCSPRRTVRATSQRRRPETREYFDSNRYSVLTEDEPKKEELSLLEMGELYNLDSQKWRPLPKPMVVDSGAGETVLPSSWLPEHRTEESELRHGEWGQHLQRGQEGC